MRRFAVFIAIAAAGLAGGWPLTATAGTGILERTEDQRIGGAVDGLTFSGFLGVGMDVTGDQLLIGAMTLNDPPLAHVGGVYDYRRDSASGLWTLHDLLADSSLVQNDNFGSGVARSGDVAIIGAAGRGSWRFGSVFIYRYDAAADAWILEQEIPHPGSLINVSPDECPPPRDLAKRSQFGSAVAISGDLALVSAPYEDLCFLRSELRPRTSDPGHCAVQDQDQADCRVVDWGTKKWVGTDVGVAYIFRRNATSGVWELEQRLEPTGLELEPLPDADVSIAGNIEVDEYSAAIWARRDGMIDIDGDFAVVGDDRRDYVWDYIYNPATQQWDLNRNAPLVPPTVPLNDKNRSFGASVSIDVDWMAIGAELEDSIPDDGIGQNTGAVFIYRWSPLLESWNYVAPIGPVVLSEQNESDQFGRDVELVDDTLLVGSMPHVMEFVEFGDDKEFEAPGPGAAYVFDLDRGRPPSVTERFKLIASDGEDKDGLGGSLAYADGTVLVAAPQRNLSTGSVYSYDLVAPAPGVLPIPEPAHGLLALASTATLALLRRSATRRAR